MPEERSKFYDKIAKLIEDGIVTAEGACVYVAKGLITEAEYEEATETEYVEQADSADFTNALGDLGITECGDRETFEAQLATLKTDTNESLVLMYGKLSAEEQAEVRADAKAYELLKRYDVLE